MKMRLAISLLLPCLVTLSALAAPPPNDKFAKATPLTQTSETAKMVTTVDATIESGEYGLGAHTVWFSFKAPADGVLQIVAETFDSNLDQVSFNVVTGTSVKKTINVESTTYYDVAGAQSSTFPVLKGTVYHLQFSSGGGGTSAFDYRFNNGGGFTFADPPRVAQRVDDFIPTEIVLTEQPEWTFNEADGTVSLTVARVGGARGSAQVDWAVDFTNSSTEPADFTGATSGTLSFAPGETKKTFSIGFAADGQVEGPEYFSVALSATALNSTHTVVEVGSLFVTLEDADGQPPNDAFAAAEPLAGNSGNTTIQAGVGTIEAGEPPLQHASVWYSWTAPADGELAVTAVNADPTAERKVMAYTGATLATLQAVRPRGEVEPVPVLNPRFAVSAGTVYHLAVLDEITGDTTVSFEFKPHAVVRLSERVYEVKEGADLLPVVKNIANASTIRAVRYQTVTPDDTEDDSNFAKPAKAGDDFLTAAGQLTFAIGDRSKSFAVTAKADTKKEPLEFFDVALQSDDSDVVVDSAYQKARVYIVDKNAGASPFDDFFSGNYIGVFATPAVPVADGTVQITFAKKRLFTGSLLLGGKKLPFKGSFPPALETDGVDRAETVVNVEVKGGAAIPLTLVARIFDVNFLRLTGSVAVNGSNAPFVMMETFPFSANFPAPIAGTYTLSLTPGAGAPAAFQAPGVASVTVTAKGVAKIVGTLPDGTKLVGAGLTAYVTPVNDAGVYSNTYNVALPIGIPLYHNAGAVVGILRPSIFGHAQPPIAGDGDATLRWSRPAVAPAPAFNVPLQSFVSRLSLAKNELVLAGNPKITFSGAGLGAGSTTQSLQLNLGNKFVAVANDPLMPMVKFNVLTGFFSGSFVSGTTKIPFNGAILRNMESGAGFFLNGGQAGTVQLFVP